MFHCVRTELQLEAEDAGAGDAGDEGSGNFLKMT